MIQATPFCNIDCSYCYLPNRSKKGQFSLDLLEPLFTKLLQSGLLGESVSVVWHAGEPLVLSPAYYREAIERIHRLVDGKPTGAPVLKAPQALTLTTEPQANVERYDALREAGEARHAS